MPRASMKSARTQKRQPGREAGMRPAPESEGRSYQAASKLEGKVALVTGGDSGIGRAVSVLFAKEGADIAILYYDEHKDARHTEELVVAEGRRCLLFAGDIGDQAFCKRTVDAVVKKLGRLDVVVNNAGEQHVQKDAAKITAKQLERTFRTNVFGTFYVTLAALDHLKPGASIINTSSVTAFRGSAKLVDYAATKGALVGFTRALSSQLVEKGIRVNAVAPGPIWTPLIPASFDKKDIASFGKHTPMERPGQPDEVAPCYVFLASDDASYMSGQVLHPNGGEMVG